MYVLSFVAGCLLYAGCFTGERNPDMASVWITAPTAAECERGNLDALHRTAEANGDVVVWARVTCERMGT